MAGPALKELKRRLAGVPAAEREFLRRRLSGLERRARQGKPFDRALQRLESDLGRAETRHHARRSVPLMPEYDPALPITAHRAELIRAIRDHQVVVVAGETGSGKTTQLPKLCLEAGRGEAGLIGCTQPRRIAARSVSERVAEELGVELGGPVGYQVRFTDRTSPETRVKFMTDGILLVETQGDPRLAAYDTLIIDEAHERSLNIDFLLGYLKRLLPRRPDLKVVITSATIDTKRFAQHFDEAPVIEVSGRGYPVETRYRPLDAVDGDLYKGIANAVGELGSEDPRGDILVFLSGEREIREAADTLRRESLGNTEVLPLFGRLSAAEQHRIFHPGPGRRIVLATNVAETSLTVPRIRFVIDSGLARISRYSPRSKLQRLPVEPVSRASADQRQGRCGRLAPGICIRLYSEADFEARADYTEPEILRTNLASVILRMRALRLGEVEDFPFLEPPDTRLINDGYQLLFELGALDAERELTGTGRLLHRLPVDPRLGRMLLAAAGTGCLDAVLVIAAVLSVQDPRERPVEARQAADEAHAEWQDGRSDFMAWLTLWDRFSGVGGAGRQKRWCREHFLAFNRMREWREIHRQLAGLAGEIGLAGGGSRDYERIHRALLAGLVTNVGRREEGDTYEAPRQRRFHVHPGSGLAARPPKWVVSAALVETARVFARDNAAVKPDWIEDAASHVSQRSHHDPHYDRRTARVYAYERTLLYGLILRERRRVHYGPHAPREARDMFIRHALVRGEYDTRAGFMAQNLQLMAEVRELEERQRRRDVLESEATLFRFFDQRVPEAIYTGKAFEQWRRRAEADDPKILFLDRETLMRHQAVDVTAERYPDTLVQGGGELALAYHFEPGHPADGVTLTVPLHALNTLDFHRLEWLVPGLIREKMETLVKGLPKRLRRNLVPVPDFVQAALEAMPWAEGNLYARLARELSRMSGMTIAEEDLRGVNLPDHLRMNLRIVGDECGEILAQGRDPEALRAEWGLEASRAFGRRAGTDWYRDEVTDWDFGELPERVELAAGMAAWPALEEQESGACLRLFETPDEADAAHRRGLRSLLMTVLADKRRYLERNPPVPDRACLHYAPVDSCQALREDFLAALFDRMVARAGEVRDADAFRRLVSGTIGSLLAEARDFGEQVAVIVERHARVSRALDGKVAELWPPAAADMADQLAWLVWPGFLRDVPPGALAHYPRYLEALDQRLASLREDPAADRRKMAQVEPYWQAYQEAVGVWGWPGPPELDRIRWMVEEFRVSLFAQPLGTAQPISPKRLDRALAELASLE